ncbi:MAG: hypothetical protein ABI165_01470 [Bryobacteraceae bacterium]
MAALFAVAGIGAFYYLTRRAPETFSFQAVESNGQVVAQWDPRSPAIKNAKRATLEISESTSLLNLDASQLRGGTAVYKPKSDDVSLRLTVISANGQSAEQTVRFVGHTAASDAAKKAADDLATQLRQANARADQLQQQLRALHQQCDVGPDDTDR